MKKEILYLHVDKCSEKRKNLLTELLDNTPKFFTAPASSAVRYHEAHEGGLLDHVLLFISIGLGFVPKYATYDEMITVAILHDLRKVGDTKGNDYYVPNISDKTGKRSVAEPYKHNSETYLQYPCNEPELNYLLKEAHFTDGECCLAYLDTKFKELHDDLSENEKQAILFHDLSYNPKFKYSGHYGKESNLTIVVHTADMLSSRHERNQQSSN